MFKQIKDMRAVFGTLDSEATSQFQGHSATTGHLILQTLKLDLLRNRIEVKRELT